MGVSNSHISPHSADVRSRLPEKNNYSKNLRIALYQHDRFALQALTGFDPAARQQDPKYKITSANATKDFLGQRFCDLHPSFTAENLSVECFVELVEKRWDVETVRLFLSVGPTAEMLATFIATCTIRNHYPALRDTLVTLVKILEKSPLYAEDVATKRQRRAAQHVKGFAGGENDTADNGDDGIVPLPEAFVAKHNLQHLFPIVCHQNDDDTMMLFIQAGLYEQHSADAAAAALRIVAGTAMRKHQRLLQRYGNAILAPLPPMNPAAAAAAAAANPPPEWLVEMLKASAASTAAATGTERVVGDGFTAAPIGTHGHGAGAASSSASPSDAPQCPYTDAELAQTLADPSTGTISARLPNTVLEFVAPIVFILATHHYPGRATIEALQKEALRTAVIKTKGSREVAGWQLYQREQEEIAKQKKSSKLVSSTSAADADAAAVVEVKNIPLMSPIAAILAVADGPWTPDTHNMKSPLYRSSVRAIFHALQKKQQLSEDEINLILQFLPDDEERTNKAKAASNQSNNSSSSAPSPTASPAASPEKKKSSSEDEEEEDYVQKREASMAAALSAAAVASAVAAANNAADGFEAPNAL